MTFLAVLAAVLLLGVDADVARAYDGNAAARPTITTSSASYARDLHRWFPREIRLPRPRRSSTVAVSPQNLCKARDLGVHREQNTAIVFGSVAIDALPSGFRVADESASEYRVAAFGYVVPRSGRPIWAGEVTMPGRNMAPAGGMPSLGFSATTQSLDRGGSLVVILVGEPIALGGAGSGEPMILGSCVQRF